VVSLSGISSSVVFLPLMVFVFHAQCAGSPPGIYPPLGIHPPSHSPSSSCHTQKLYALPPLTPPLPLPRPSPPPHPLIPCWSRRESLAVSPLYHSLLLSRFLGGLLLVNSEFPSPCGYSGGGKVASEGIGAHVCVQQELWAYSGYFWCERPHPLSCSVVYWAPEHQMCWCLRRVVAAAA